MGRKTAETTHNINTFGPEAANEHRAQWWFKKICKRNESLEDELSSQPSEVDNNQLRISSKLILLWLHEKLLKNSTWTNLWSFCIWSKLERQKNSVSGYPMLLLLLSRFSHVRLCATPEMAAHQAPPSLGFSRQEHWNGLPYPSPMHESEKSKWSRSVMSDS